MKRRKNPITIMFEHARKRGRLEKCIDKLKEKLERLHKKTPRLFARSIELQEKLGLRD
jgi:hypothetical protein